MTTSNSRTKLRSKDAPTSDNCGLSEVGPGSDIGRFPALRLTVADYVERSRAPATRRAHRSDWDGFLVWCALEGRRALPASPQTVAEFMAAHAVSHKPATLRRWLSTIAVAHDTAGVPSPTRDVLVRSVLAGINRTYGVAPTKKTALVVPDLQRVLAALPTTTTGLRDRSVLTLGFVGSFRRSELASFDLEDVAFETDGLVLNLRKSKTDQAWAGRLVGIPAGDDSATCPVHALTGWLAAAGINEGPIFRGVGRYGHVSPRRLCDKSIANIVKAAATRVGLDHRKFAGHSLRSGFITSASRAGLDAPAIARQSGHSDLRVLRGYVERARVLDDSPALAVRL